MKDVNEQSNEPLQFSFSGGGWLMLYMFGVAKALQESGLDQKAKFIGTSAGALTAVGLALGTDFDALSDTIIDEYLPQVHNQFNGAFQVAIYLQNALIRHGNLHKYQELNDVKDKVTITYTSISKWRSQRVSNFLSQEHLMTTLLASCCAAPLVGLPIVINGEWAVDGGFVDNQPLFYNNKPTVTICPQSGSTADIRPIRHTPFWRSFYPPSAKELRELYTTGYKDAWQYINNSTEISKYCSKQPTISTAPSVMDYYSTLAKHREYKSISEVLLFLQSAIFFCQILCIMNCWLEIL